MTGLAQAVIAVAQAQVGYHEGRDADGNWNNIEKFAGQVPGLAWANGQAWCAVFASYCALKGGAAKYYPSTASCDAAYDWFKAHAHVSEYPAIGAQVFYGTASDKQHTGIVVSYDADHIHTVEGNSNSSGSAQGDGVYAQTRLRRSSYVQAYGYPSFPEGIVSADPAWAKGHL